tara:strand:- start:1828 stop:2766 length:939 start_codon:yes stop_codon:yes gene_type:complete
MKLDKCYLLLGSTGVLGKNLKKYLESVSQDIFTVSRDKNNSLKKIKNHFSGDLSDKNFIDDIAIKLSQKFMHIDIFYLAGTSSVEESLNDIGTNFSKSIICYCNTLNAFRDKNVKIIFTSSGSVYGEKKLNYFSEKNKLIPASPYAATKIACENLSLIYTNLYKMDIRIARIFSTYGASMHKLFIYDCVKKMNNSKSEVVLRGSGKQIRDYLYIDDISSALMTILNNGEYSNTYNVCSGKPQSISDIANKIRNSLKLNCIKITWSNIDTKSEKDQWYGNNSKLKRLGFKEKNSFDSMLDYTVKNIQKDLKEK